MAKVLRIAAVVVAIAAAIPTGGTSLLGSGLMSAGVAGSAAAATTMASALALGMSFATQLTMKKPSVEGGQTEWQSDPNASVPIVFGRTMVGGKTVFRTTTSKVGGTKNKFQFVTTVLSGCGPIESIDKTYVDKADTSFVGDSAIGSLSGRVYQKTQLGLCPEPSALSPTGPWPSIPGWTAAHKMSGYAAVMNTLVFDGKGDNTFTQVPRIQWLGKFVKCYDPRLDSTYPGGVGACRSNDQTTWVFSKNPWIQLITFAIGWKHGPNDIRVGGVGMPVDSIDFPAFVEAANIADLNDWESGGLINSDENKWNAMKSLAQSGGGEPVRLGATLSCVINTPRIAIGTITLDDVVGDISVTTTQTQRDRINGVIPMYRSEDHFFEKVPAGVVRNSTYLAEDGKERTKEIDYPMVQCEVGQTPDQVAQLAAYEIVNAREAAPIVVPLKLRFLGYKTGDCLSFENAPEFRYLAGKSVIVIRRQLDPGDGTVVLTCREETTSKHAWALGRVGTPAPSSAAPSIQPIAEPPEPSEWTIAPHVEVLGSITTGTIQFTGSVQDDTAERVRFEYREHGTTEWIQSGELSINTTIHEIMNLSTDRIYDVAVSYHFGQRLEFIGIALVDPSFDRDDITFDSDYITFDRD